MRKSNLIPSRALITAQSLGASFNGPTTNVSILDNCAYQINVTTSDAVGTFTVQGSIDNINFVALPSVSTVTLASANVSALIVVNQTPVPYIRISYARTSGTGTGDIWISAKMI